jgi:hypothetical protein
MFQRISTTILSDLPEDLLVTCFEPEGNKGIRRKQQLPAFYHVYKGLGQYSPKFTHTVLVGSISCR